jgi:hypothetical protein
LYPLETKKIVHLPPQSKYFIMNKAKTLLLLIVAFVLSANVHTQEVIASAGGYFENEDISISWTIGETVTETFIGNDIIFTQGFQQPNNFYLTQILNIPVGWSGVSSFVEPVNKNVGSIFAPFENDFIILASMTAFYYPAGGANTIGNWSHETGYQIKAVNEFNISMTGTKITDPTVDMQTGWNLMPVPVSCETAVADLFGDVSGLQIAKEVAGTGVYWPEYGIATLPDIAPGKAYWVAMSNSQSITYPACTKSIAREQQPLRPKINSPWNDLNYTALSHPIAFPAGVLLNTGIQVGDIIGVFTPEGLCAGQTEITDVAAGTAIIAFANDATTSEKDGFDVGEMFHFKLYSYQQNEEYELSVTYDQSLPNTSQFENQGMSAVTAVAFNPTSAEENQQIFSDLYPNPSSGNFNLALNRWPEKLQIHLLDSRGTTLEIFTPGTKLNGSSFQFNLEHLPTGVYFLKLVDRQMIEVKKVVIH